MTHQDKRQQIMLAAEQLLRHRQVHQVTLDEVAQKARVGKGTLYLYFKDKEDLFFQTAISSFDQLRVVLEEHVPQDASFDECLLNACKQIIAFFEQRRPLMRMIQIEEGRVISGKGKLRARWLEKRQELINTLAGIMKRGIDEGRLRRDVPPVVLAFYLLGMLRARVRDLGDAPETQRRLSLLIDLFLSGSVPRGVTRTAMHKDHV
jgi:AcrR family transcriptional regulator